MESGSSSSRVWFVTGSSSGFGRAISESVIEGGNVLVATARDSSSLVSLGQDGGEVLALDLDVTDVADVRRAVEAAIGRFGRIDVLMNNAGFGLRGAVEEVSEGDMREQFETNVFGVLNVTRAVLPHMRQRRSGHIVQMSSVGGVVATVGGGLYAGTKFAVEGISEALASEVAHLGIKVTLVEPGPFRTDFAGRSMRESDAIEDYAESVGAAHEHFVAMDGRQPNDPVLGARAIIRAVEAVDPPLRLPLGPESFQRIRSKIGAQLKEMDAWEEIGAATSFEKSP